MKNDENTDTDFSPEPMGESTIKCSEGNEAEAKKHRAEVSTLTISEGYFSFSHIDKPFIINGFHWCIWTTRFSKKIILRL